MDPTVVGNEYLKNSLISIIESETPIEKVIELNVPTDLELSQSVSETLFKFAHEYSNYLENIESPEIQTKFREYLQHLVNTYSFLVGTRRFPEIKKEDFIEKLDLDDDKKYRALKAGLHIQNKYINDSEADGEAGADREAEGAAKEEKFFQRLSEISGIPIDNMQLHGYILTKGDDKIIIKKEDITTDNKIPLGKDYTIPENDLEIFRGHLLKTGDIINLEPYINILLLTDFDDVERLQKENNEIIKILNEIIKILNEIIERLNQLLNV